MSNVRLTHLENDLAVVSLEMPEVETAAISLTADVGARQEDEAENGLAHLYEHMVFKGTAKRSARGIAEEIEDVGGMLNAWTSRDSTCFHARILGDDVPLALDLLADLTTSARFDEQDLALEREVVLSEIGEALETPDDLVFDLLQEVAFPAQSLGRPVLGTVNSLTALDTDALRHWRETQYRGSGLVLSAAGKVDHESLVEQAQWQLGKIAAGRPRSIEPAKWAGGTNSAPQAREQTHIALGYQGYGPRDSHQEAARLFATALGGGMSSRLFQQLREERGLAYSVSASHSMHADTGLLALYIATRPKDAAEALDLLCSCALVAANELAQDELDRARAQVKAGILMSLEGCASQADWLGSSFLTYGRVIPTSELIADLEKVTLEEVRNVGTKMLASPAALSVVGPAADRLSL